MNNNCIFILEDNATAELITKPIMQNYNYKIFCAEGITTAIDRIDDEPGIQYFDFLIVDLNVDYEDSEFYNQCDAEWILKQNKGIGALLAGWMWLKRYVLESENELCKALKHENRIIVFSAYLSNLPIEERKKYPELIFINKDEENSLTRLLEAIKPRR